MPQAALILVKIAAVYRQDFRQGPNSKAPTYRSGGAPGTAALSGYNEFGRNVELQRFWFPTVTARRFSAHTPYEVGREINHTSTRQKRLQPVQNLWPFREKQQLPGLRQKLDLQMREIPDQFPNRRHRGLRILIALQ